MTLYNAFKTTAGTVYKKIRTGDTFEYTADGEPTSRQAFAGANRHFDSVISDENGALPAAYEDADSADRLEQLTGIPFTNDGFASTRGDLGKKETELRAEQNRFQGFWSRQPHLGVNDRTEAAKRYMRFRNDLRQAEDPEARAIIKHRYNVPGS